MWYVTHACLRIVLYRHIRKCEALPLSLLNTLADCYHDNNIIIIVLDYDGLLLLHAHVENDPRRKESLTQEQIDKMVESREKKCE